MKTTISAICCVAVLVFVSSASAQTLALGDAIGIDFASPNAVFPDPKPSTTPPAAGTNFNAFDTTVEDLATESFSGTLINLAGGTTSVGFSVTNNSGKASGLTGVAGTPGPAPFDDATIGVDNFGAANVGNLNRPDGGPLNDDGNFVFTFSGLDDNLAYEVTGGYLQLPENANFNTTWDIDGQSATTDGLSGMPDAGYITLTNLATDGSGNLAITVTRSVQLFVAGLTITAVEPVGPDCVLGDVNTDGAVDFFDIQPFIDVLSSGGMQCEADIDEDGDVTFFDIQPFINILSMAP